MLQALQEVLLGADKWLRVKILINENTTDIDDATVEFEWICSGYGTAKSSGFFEWYKSLYGNSDQSPDEPAVICLTPVAITAAVTEHKNVPPPPLEQRRNMIIEGIVKDAVFGERVEWSRLFVGTYPVGIGKHWEDKEETEQLDVYFKAEFASWIKKSRLYR
ncbi:hypothetical protein BGZ83_006967 [Gryganskiella cystojenkinii]|nr:hypothetical protein BGZ83_006967 [Gryganskiella cystojenkinii]